MPPCPIILHFHIYVVYISKNILLQHFLQLKQCQVKQHRTKLMQPLKWYANLYETLKGFYKPIN